MAEFLTVPLSRARVAKIDPEDFALAYSKWHANYSAPTKAYAVCRMDGRRVYMHRMIARAPAGVDVDHINGDTLDNRRSNLRLATRSENLRNSVFFRTGGAYYDKQTGRWFARVSWNGRRLMLGRAETKDEAQRRVTLAKQWLEAGAESEEVLARLSAQSSRGTEEGGRTFPGTSDGGVDPNIEAAE